MHGATAAVAGVAGRASSSARDPRHDDIEPAAALQLRRIRGRHRRPERRQLRRTSLRRGILPVAPAAVLGVVHVCTS